MCLEFLAELVPALRPRAFLDLGTGSGVLALAAAALGAREVLGVDPCPRAVSTARANSRRNGLEKAIRVVRGTAACLRGSFPLLAANLPFAVLCAEAGSLSRLAGPVATLVLSGFREVQEAELLTRFRPAGWRLTARRARDDWPLVLPPEDSFTWVAWILRRPG
jgi:ribosomal protein L11 methyltransferase